MRENHSGCCPPPGSGKRLILRAAGDTWELGKDRSYPENLRETPVERVLRWMGYANTSQASMAPP